MTETLIRDRVRVTIDAGVADVCLARPDKRNALDPQMFRALVEAGEQVGADRAVRAAVLRGEGPSFCAGLDLAAMAVLAGAPGDNAPGSIQLGDTDGRITHLAQHSCWVWQEVPVPVIAAVHGHALGGGIQLALAADVRVVHPDSVLSVREVYWGLIPDMTGTLTLSRLCGLDVAKELVYTARKFDGREAHRLGLATHLADDPGAEARRLAATIAERSPDAVRGAKRLFNDLAFADAATAFANERRVIGSLVGGPNQMEAVTAHFEGRPPAFADPFTDSDDGCAQS